MPPRPKRVQLCPSCRQRMSWFGDHWVCVNYKGHNTGKGKKFSVKRKGKKLPPRSRKKQRCPFCGRFMAWSGERWFCQNASGHRKIVPLRKRRR